MGKFKVRKWKSITFKLSATYPIDLQLTSREARVPKIWELIWEYHIIFEIGEYTSKFIKLEKRKSNSFDKSKPHCTNSFTWFLDSLRIDIPYMFTSISYKSKFLKGETENRTYYSSNEWLIEFRSDFRRRPHTFW